MAGQKRQALPEEAQEWKRTRKWCARLFGVLLGLFLTALLALGGIYWFLQRDPQALARSSLEELEKATGLKCSFGTVIVSLMPLPSVAIYDLRIQAENADLSIALVLARPALGDIIRGRFIPASLEIFRPVFSCHVDARLNELSDLKELIDKIPAGKTGDPSVRSASRPNLPDKISIAISNGRIRMFGADRTGIIGRNLHAELDFSRGRHFGGKLEMSRLRLYHQRKRLISLEELSLAGRMQNNSPELAEFFTAITIPGWLYDGRLKLDFNKNGVEGWQLVPDFRANFAPGQSWNMPVALSGSISGTDNKIITFSNMLFQMDADSGQLDMLLKTGPALADYSALGTIQLHRASLAQWLGFARNLPPGLQIALDNISRARLEFSLDSKKLSVPSIIATSTGASFTGSGGVADFAKPVVALDLHSPEVNLGLALPESLAKSPLPASFPFAPLTPMPGEPIREGETGIDYDIRLSAEKLVYGPLLLENSSLRIYPGALDRKLMLEDVLLDAKAGLAGGKLTGHCILGADPSLPCNITASASGINAASIARQWKDFPLARGTLAANANVFSKGKELDVFLAHLNGPVNVTGVNAQLKSGLKSPFSRLELGSRLKSGRAEKNGVSFDGQWRLGANADFGEIKADASGRIQLDAKGMQLRGLSANSTMTLRKLADFLPDSLSVNAKGALSGSTSDSVFSAQKLEADLLGVHLSGNASFNANKLSCSGKINADAPDLPATLGRLGMKSSDLPPALGRLKLQADFTAAPDRLRLEKLNASFNNLKLSGSLELLKKAIPDLSFNLTADTVDLQNFQSSRPPKAGEKWNFSALKELNAQGSLRIATLTGFGMRFGALNMPLKLSGGKMQLGPASANFCGARVNGRANADFSRGISFSSVFSAHGFNLGEAARERKIESELSGNASLDANVRADLTGPGQFLKNMDGNWSIKVSNGSWQGRAKNGKLEGKPVKFSLVSASGTIAQAVMRTDNLELQSPDLKVSGKGWMNVEKNTMDSTLNVNMKNMPDFPLYIWGPVEKPKTSIGAGKLVLNAIGGFTTGIANVFGGMVDGVVNIFR